MTEFLKLIWLYIFVVKGVQCKLGVKVFTYRTHHIKSCGIDNWSHTYELLLIIDELWDLVLLMVDINMLMYSQCYSSLIIIRARKYRQLLQLEIHMIYLLIINVSQAKSTRKVQELYHITNTWGLLSTQSKTAIYVAHLRSIWALKNLASKTWKKWAQLWPFSHSGAHSDWPS